MNDSTLILTNDLEEIHSSFKEEQLTQEIISAYCIEDENLISESDILSFLEEERDERVNDFSHALSRYQEDYNVYSFIIFGRKKRWNGTVTGFDIATDPKELLSKVCEAGIENFEFTKDCKNLSARAYHHDGTNYFTIFPITEKGVNMAISSLEKGVKAEKISENLINKGAITSFFSNDRDLIY